MTLPKDLQLPAHLLALARQLLELSPEDRDLVIRFVRANAPPTRQKFRGVPWEHLEKLNGVVAIGGNAVEDCRALYDDC
ncbi:MAG TPA: hypothetical protein VIV60_34530 [Polyangiaceae bacterium]